MFVPTYYFAYKNADGTANPITIEEWAAKVLTGAELTKCKETLARQTDFKNNLSTYCFEFVFPFTSNRRQKVRDFADYSEVSDSVIYRFYNFTDYLIEFELKHMADKFEVDLNSVDTTLLDRFRHTLKARILVRYLNWYIAINGETYPPVHAILKYNGSNVSELRLDETYGTIYPGIWDNPPVFPDADWEKYWDQFLKDPNIVVVYPTN